MIRSHPDHGARRAGFTLIDLLVSVAIFCILIAALGRSITGLAREQTGISTANRLQDQGVRAIEAIRADLRRSGFVPANGVDYPYLFEDGAAEIPFEAHIHLPAAKEAEPGDPDFGPNREIVLCQPADGDGDHIPDVDANGALVWDVAEISVSVA